MTSRKFDYIEIVEHKNFTRLIDELEKENPRIAEVKDAIAWLLGRKPTHGEHIGEYEKHRVFHTNAIGSVPAYWVVCRYDTIANQVELLSIKACPEGEAEED